jgi:hypothetical protein
MQRLGWITGWLVAVAVGVLVQAPEAQACGGLFCNQSNPVNQAAERIIFADNGDGTVTAVIEIQYQGPAEQFSWVLPVPGVPTVEVSSVLALDQLQQATNPQYNLITSFEDGCNVPVGGSVANGADFDAAPEAPNGGVTVLAEATVGPFDYQVIALDPALSEPADAAIDWLTENGYDVTALGPERLGPYLADGLNLIAFRLSKTSSSGSIRPILLTYETDLPYIPIRPTAVAATEEMGVLVWVVGGQRAIASNYKTLELNEALIDWFNPMNSYNAVVIAAANEAGGQGFVTEQATQSDTLEGVVVQQWQRDTWQELMSGQYAQPIDFLFEASNSYSGWDGWQDAVSKAVTLPEGVSSEDFLLCPRCYSDEPGFVLDESELRRALFEEVVKPMFATEDLLQSRPYITRLYTTLSPEEMTLDPVFDFNGELPDVSNIHTADQIMSCQSEDWRVELASGDVVFGSQAGVWPNALGDQPATRRILQLSPQGMGETVTDNREAIRQQLLDAVPEDQQDMLDRFRPLEDEPVGGGGRSDGEPAANSGDGGLCAVHVPGRDTGAGGSLLLLALGALFARRRVARHR